MKSKSVLLLFIGLLFFTVFLMGLLRMYIPSSRDLPQIMKDSVLNVVLEYNSVDFYIDGDSPAGLQYELCQYIAKRSGLRVEISLENDLDASIKGLEDKQFDVIARNIPITNESRKRFTFTVPVRKSRQVLVQRKPTENDTLPLIRNQIELANKTIYIVQNSPARMRLENLAEEIAEPVHVREIGGYTSEQLIYMVDSREIDYAVIDEQIASKNAKLYPNLDFKTAISFMQLQAWAVRANSPVLLDSLNVWINDFVEGK